LRVEALEDRTVPTTFLVTNLFDSGGGSLRQAILDANSNAGFDDIRFNPGLQGTIPVFSGQLAITDSVSIIGPGAGLITVSAIGSRVFEVDASSPNTTSISGLTIANGTIPTGNGGGILNFATLTLASCTISGNQAPQDGGGIYNDTLGILTLVSCNVS